jgi:hypothetical protein
LSVLSQIIPTAKIQKYFENAQRRKENYIPEYTRLTPEEDQRKTRGGPKDSSRSVGWYS